MRKVLGLLASGRKRANGETLVKEAFSAIKGECRLELIKLTELRWEICKGCFACLIPGQKCPLKDDLYYLAEQIKEADGVILAAPCYVLGPAAVTKLLGDRTIALTQFLDDFWDKPCAIIATAGGYGWEGYTLSALISSVRSLGFAVKDAHLFIGALPGEAILNPGARERVRLLGTRLFGEPRQPENSECPTCWSNIWNFPEPGSAVCPLCGQKAELVTTNGGIEWVFGPKSDRYTKEQLEHHNQELKGQVRGFLDRRGRVVDSQTSTKVKLTKPRD